MGVLELVMDLVGGVWGVEGQWECCIGRADVSVGVIGMGVAMVMGWGRVLMCR
jgi:hypothetical protein